MQKNSQNMHFQSSLELRSFDPSSLIKYQTLIENLVLACTPIVVLKVTSFLPRNRKRFTLLRSPFVHKKSQEHFGIYSAKLFLTLQSQSPEGLTLFLNYLRHQLPLNIGYKITTKAKYFIK